jgi:PBP1b-binding outer membrane lipoprotein LpoB
MKIIVMAVAVAAVLSGCVSRTYEKETVTEPRSSGTVVVPQGATAPSGTTVVVPQSSPARSNDTTVIVPR